MGTGVRVGSDSVAVGIGVRVGGGSVAVGIGVTEGGTAVDTGEGAIPKLAGVHRRHRCRFLWRLFVDELPQFAVQKAIRARRSLASAGWA